MMKVGPLKIKAKKHLKKKEDLRRLSEIAGDLLKVSFAAGVGAHLVT